MKTRAARWLILLAMSTAGIVAVNAPATADSALIPAGGVLRVNVPEAFGGKTVIGQVTVDRATNRGFITAYGCDDGIPRNSAGEISKSDLNYNGTVTPVASNRLIVEADNNGDICFYTRSAVAMIIDINAVSFDGGITSLANRRTDTRSRTTPLVAQGDLLRVNVPEAAGGKTVIGQVTVDRATNRGFITAYGCDDGIPRNSAGEISKSDLNYNGTVTPVASNRLIVEADNNGDICFYTYSTVAIIIDINGVSGSRVSSFDNLRTDSRATTTPVISDGGQLRVNVPEAADGKTVVGQVTVDRATDRGFVTAFGCEAGVPRNSIGEISKSDLNYNGTVTPVASNRLIVEADNNGDICFYTHSTVAIIIDINGVSDGGITSFPNQRTDTRTTTQPAGPVIPPGGNGVPVWPSYTPSSALLGIAALTGEPASVTVANRPILAVKIDNYRHARPQWGLDDADAVIEENVEGVTRFIAMFQTTLPDEVGPVRSARTADLDLLTAMNRPVFAYSGANSGVTAWIGSAADSGILVDYTAQHRPCYSRDPDRPGPHNLLLDPTCAIDEAAEAGPARPLWSIDATWTIPAGVTATPDTTFTVPMDGVEVSWTWDPSSNRYLRSQDGVAHVAVSGTRISAQNVVEVFSRHVPSVVDARSPHPITTGTGPAVIHRDGYAIAGTWVRETPYDSFTFLDASTGAPVPLDTGTTFVQLTRDE